MPLMHYADIIDDCYADAYAAAIMPWRDAAGATERVPCYADY